MINVKSEIVDAVNEWDETMVKFWFDNPADEAEFYDMVDHSQGREAYEFLMKFGRSFNKTIFVFLSKREKQHYLVEFDWVDEKMDVFHGLLLNEIA